jgi:hypothetical protein
MDIGEQKRVIQVEPEPVTAPAEEPARDPIPVRVTPPAPDPSRQTVPAR